MKTVKLEHIKNTVKRFKNKEITDGPVNTDSGNSKLQEHPPFELSPGMVNGKGDIIDEGQQQ